MNDTREGTLVYDILIIGAGVTGCACARELSRYEAKILVIDKEEDVCSGTSKANSAIVHAGYDATPGSLMAKLNVEGNTLMGHLAQELDIPFRRNGSFVICFSEEDRPGLDKLLAQGRANGVPDLRIVEHDELLEMEPNLSDEIVAALYAPTAGIICPFILTLAMAENANVNGVDFRFNTTATSIRRLNGHFVVDTDQGSIETRAVINAAGVYSDKFHNLFAEKKLHITPRRGDYCLLDKAASGIVDKTIFPLPSKYGKGILVAPTINGNTLMGPTAIDVDDPEATNTTAEGIESLLAQAARSVKSLPTRQIITSFAGLRAHEDGHEFVIGELPEAPGFFDCAGIESPGLTSSPAVGRMVAGEVSAKLGLAKKSQFISTRKGILDPKKLSPAEYASLIQKEPAYGQVICRCETVTEGEIIDAIRRPLGAKSVDAVRRRTRAGMGRCQGGFCTPRVMEILAREWKVPMASITKFGPGSELTVGGLTHDKGGDGA